MDNNPAQQELKRFECAEKDAATWRSTWQDIADYVVPRKSEIDTVKTKGIDGFTDNLHDTTAVHANLTLGSGQLDYLFSGRWLVGEPPVQITDKERRAKASKWYRMVGEIMLEVLNSSNHQLMVHEFLLDRSGFGTALQLCEEDDEDLVYFTNDVVGKFYLVNDRRGLVCEVFREFKLNAQDAEEKYGRENLGENILKCLKSDKQEDRYKEFNFIQRISKRKNRDIKKKDAKNKAWESVHTCKEDKKVVKESGYDEQPFAASRFLMWGDTAYGYCPSIEALPTIRMLNFIEKNLDALASLAVNPRVLIPDSLVGDVDLSDGGITIFKANNPNEVPREWGTGGRYDIGKDRSQLRRETVEKAFFVDLFQMFTNIDEMKREKTAFEVNQMLAEKLSRISPSFIRLKIEYMDVILKRVFSILYRKGIFGAAPEEAFVVDSAGNPSIGVPKFNYMGKLAQALKTIDNQNFISYVQLLGSVAQVDPEGVIQAFENKINLDRSIESLGQNAGVAHDFWNTEDEEDEIKEQRQAAMEQAQQMAMMQQGAEAAGKLSPELQNKLTEEV